MPSKAIARDNEQHKPSLLRLLWIMTDEVTDAFVAVGSPGDKAR